MPDGQNDLKTLYELEWPKLVRVEEDGQELGLDDDFQRNRINVVVTHGIVTDLLPVG